MNEMFSVILDFEPGDEKIEEIINRMDEVIEENGWKYSGIFNLYKPMNEETRDETIHDVVKAVRRIEWLKPYHPRVLLGNWVDKVKWQDVDVSKMKAPSKKKLEKYEEYYNSAKEMAHCIVVDENGKIRDGYISYLLAWKYSARVEVLSTWKKQPLKKVVLGKHVDWDGEHYKEKGENRYWWVYDLEDAVIPGDILLVHTRKGLAHMRVEKIDYVTGNTACTKYRKVKRNETV